jgi:hypothetical protein
MAYEYELQVFDIEDKEFKNELYGSEIASHPHFKTPLSVNDSVYLKNYYIGKVVEIRQNGSLVEDNDERRSMAIIKTEKPFEKLPADLEGIILFYCPAHPLGK